MNQELKTAIAGKGFGDSGIWRAMTQAMEALEAVVWNDPLVKDDLTRAEGLRYLTRLVAGAMPMTMEMPLPAYPQFFHMLTTRIHWGLPATDCYYVWAALHSDYTYRIKGDRGSAHIFDIETRTGHFARVLDWKLFDRRSQFEVGPDNQVEIVLSTQEQPGNWIKLPEGPSNIIFRQYFYDWNREERANLTIRADGADYPPRALTTADIAERAQLFIDWIGNLSQRFQQVVHTYYQAPDNSMVFDSIDFGWKDLQYGKGHYVCAEDEALILEVKLPQTDYWSIQLCSHFWEARDYQQRQTSLNGAQARIDDDGVFRAVISHGDPGVPNWLDAGGHERGLIAIRYYRADAAPIPTIRRIKLQDVHKQLPATTPAVSPEQRQKSLQQRAWSVTRRGFED